MIAIETGMAVVETTRRPKRYALTVAGDVVTFERVGGRKASPAFTWSIADVTAFLAGGRLAVVVNG